MVIAFGFGSGCCVVGFICSNQVITSIDYYTRREGFGSLRVYPIHSNMRHRACRVFATPGM